jgi:hypothetical protein
MEACLVFSDFPLQPVARKKEKKRRNKEKCEHQQLQQRIALPILFSASSAPV